VKHNSKKIVEAK